MEGACLRNPTLPLADQTGPQLDANHALILASESGGLTRVLAAGQGRFCGRLLRRGIPSDVESVRRQAQRSEGLPDEVSAAFWVGIGSGLVEERDAPVIPPALRDLPGVEMNFVLYGAGRAVGKIHRAAVEPARRSWLQALDADERPAFERGLGDGEFQ
jgi:hypothetical protein